MIKMFQWGGPWMWIILIIAIANVVLTIKNGLELRPGVAGKKDSGRGINAILFWGAMGAVGGFLGQITGIYLGITEIIHATEIDPHVVAEGFAISLAPTIFGLWVFILSALVWFILRGRHKAAAARAA